MTRVLHLVAHDLRAHRTFLLAWVLIVLAHPLVATLPWIVSDFEKPLWIAVLLVVARLTIGPVVLGVVCQPTVPSMIERSGGHARSRHARWPLPS